MNEIISNKIINIKTKKLRQSFKIIPSILVFNITTCFKRITITTMCSN